MAGKASSDAQVMPHVGMKAPWHLWLVGGFSAIFNSIGAFDYLMTTRHDAAYFEQLGYGVAQIAYFENYPVLPAIFWTVGVFGAVAASVLLLLRSRYTVPVALVALCAQAGLDVISFGFMDRLRGFGVRQATFDVVVPLGQLQNTVVGGGGKRQTHVSTAATSQRDSCKVAPQQTSGCCTGRFLLRFENWLTRMMPRRSSLWRFDIVRSSGYIIARTSHYAIPIRP